MTAAAAAADAWGEGEPAPGAVLPDDESELLGMISTLQQGVEVTDEEIDVRAKFMADSVRLQLCLQRDLARLKLASVKRALGERRK